MRRDFVESLISSLEGLDLDHLLAQAGEAIVAVVIPILVVIGLVKLH